MEYIVSAVKKYKSGSQKNIRRL